jgi:DNA-binding transcriptional MocR family regulator
MTEIRKKAAAAADGAPAFRYRRLAAEIGKKIAEGVLQPGEKLPSIRRLHRQTNLSLSTVYQAYVELEGSGLVEARARSGYYVRPITLKQLRAPSFKRRRPAPQRVNLAPVINSVIAAGNDPRFVPLGNTGMDPELLPAAALSRILKSLSRAEMRRLLAYSPSEGSEELRRQIALGTLGVLKGIGPGDIVVTNGCMEAIALSLLAVTRPGDAVAIESPTNFSFLQLLRELGLLVVEIATDPREGVDLGELEKSLDRRHVRACLFMPNFHNPLGARMPDRRKQALVDLLGSRGVPVIEDDISSELYFDGERPAPLKAFDRGGWVLTCSSFSKTLAPGLRLGWVVPGERFLMRLQRLKAGTTISTSTLDQFVVSRYLASGAYERHLRVLRGELHKQLVRTALKVQEHFPSGTRLAVPGGGSLLWVGLPPAVDGLEVYQAAFDRGIAIIPGAVCSNSRQFDGFIQLSCAAPFRRRIEEAIAALGAIVSDRLR